ncbi:MAG: hypothetical protein RR872_04370 [Mucinivorans sp.]
MKRLNNILLIALGVVLASCTKAPIGGDGSLPKGAATITIQMPKQPELPLYDEGAPVNYLTIFIFDASTKALDKRFNIERPYDVTGDAFWDNATATLIIKDLQNPANPRIVYVVAHWFTLRTDLAEITNLDQLEAAVTDLSGQPITTELLMSGKVTHTFSSAKALTVKVKRQAVCIDLTVALDPKFIATYPKIVMGEMEGNKASAELRNAPNQSYLCEQPTPALPAGNTMFNYPTVDMRQEGMMGITRTWHATFYVYENPVSGLDATNATYIIMKLPYKDGTAAVVTENYYKFRITTADITNPYATRRNKLYRIAATVLGFGKSTNSRSSIDDIPVIETTTTQIDL